MNDDLDILYRRFAFTVNQRCRSILGNAEDAREVTQEVFLKVLERGDIDIHTPSSFLYVMATRLCLNRLRDAKTRRTTPNSELLDQIVSLAPGTEATSGARHVLQRLFAGRTEDAQVMAVLHYVDGLTLQETARELSTSVSTVQRRLRQLRLDLEQLEGA